MMQRVRPLIASKVMMIIVAVLNVSLIPAIPAQSPSGKSAESSARTPDYLEIVKRYADAMLKHGRDTYGAEHSPLIAAALDRRTMKLISREQAGKIPGIREGDRSLGGANPYHDEALYHILYQLSSITGERRWADEANRTLKFFFEHCQSPQTGLMTWGEHIYWDFQKEAMGGNDTHEIGGEWEFWEESYRLAPEACRRFAKGLWEHQIADQKTGDFSRHARWSAHGPSKRYDFPRYGGQMIATWAEAYKRGGDQEFLKAIGVVLGRYQKARAPETKLVPSASSTPTRTWPSSDLELARCLWKSAPAVPEPLRGEMKPFALETLRAYLTVPHDPAGKGFVGVVDTHTREVVYDFNKNPAYSAVWATGYGAPMTAEPANRCYEVYRELSKSKDAPAEAERLKGLVLAAAGRYLREEPVINKEQTLVPGAMAAVIELMLNAQELTGEARYVRRADHFARVSLKVFMDKSSPLPKASNRHQHYEAITGGPELMLALLRLGAAEQGREMKAKS